MRVHIPSALLSYTGRRQEVDADGATLEALMDDLDRRFPGLKFRVIDEQGHVRTHMHLFVNGESTTDLSAPLDAHADVFIVMALSGG